MNNTTLILLIILTSISLFGFLGVYIVGIVGPNDHKPPEKIIKLQKRK